MGTGVSLCSKSNDTVEGSRERETRSRSPLNLLRGKRHHQGAGTTKNNACSEHPTTPTLRSNSQGPTTEDGDFEFNNFSAVLMPVPANGSMASIQNQNVSMTRLGSATNIGNQSQTTHNSCTTMKLAIPLVVAHQQVATPTTGGGHGNSSSTLFLKPVDLRTLSRGRQQKQQLQDPQARQPSPSPTVTPKNSGTKFSPGSLHPLRDVQLGTTDNNVNSTDERIADQILFSDQFVSGALGPLSHPAPNAFRARTGAFSESSGHTDSVRNMQHIPQPNQLQFQQAWQQQQQQQQFAAQQIFAHQQALQIAHFANQQQQFGNSHEAIEQAMHRTGSHSTLVSCSNYAPVTNASLVSNYAPLAAPPTHQGGHPASYKLSCGGNQPLTGLDIGPALGAASTPPQRLPIDLPPPSPMAPMINLLATTTPRPRTNSVLSPQTVNGGASFANNNNYNNSVNTLYSQNMSMSGAMLVPGAQFRPLQMSPPPGQLATFISTSSTQQQQQSNQYNATANASNSVNPNAVMSQQSNNTQQAQAQSSTGISPSSRALLGQYRHPVSNPNQQQAAMMQNTAAVDTTTDNYSVAPTGSLVSGPTQSNNNLFLPPNLPFPNAANAHFYQPLASNTPQSINNTPTQHQQPRAPSSLGTRTTNQVAMLMSPSIAHPFLGAHRGGVLPQPSESVVLDGSSSLVGANNSSGGGTNHANSYLNSITNSPQMIIQQQMGARGGGHASLQHLQARQAAGRASTTSASAAIPKFPSQLALSTLATEHNGSRDSGNMHLPLLGHGCVATIVGERRESDMGTITGTNTSNEGGTPLITNGVSSLRTLFAAAGAHRASASIPANNNNSSMPTLASPSPVHSAAGADPFSKVPQLNLTDEGSPLGGLMDSQQTDDPALSSGVLRRNNSATTPTNRFANIKSPIELLKEEHKEARGKQKPFNIPKELFNDEILKQVPEIKNAIDKAVEMNKSKAEEFRPLSAFDSAANSGRGVQPVIEGGDEASATVAVSQQENTPVAAIPTASTGNTEPEQTEPVGVFGMFGSGDLGELEKMVQMWRKDGIYDEADY